MIRTSIRATSGLQVPLPAPRLTGAASGPGLRVACPPGRRTISGGLVRTTGAQASWAVGPLCAAARDVPDSLSRSKICPQVAGVGLSLCLAGALKFVELLVLNCCMTNMVIRTMCANNDMMRRSCYSIDMTCRSVYLHVGFAQERESRGYRVHRYEA